ncbi:MAG TPA: heparan-alpha-glucosaminide N-acetyltransferase domain-containing protein [Bacteroidia bacterium]|nr:heparan-alpha-glucosaminide N-acetyltransferase domain-containing protein [Bacteroidia bacterium]
MNNRTQIADLLKGIAVLLMIQVHIIELFATQQISDSYVGKFLLFLGGPFVAPVFAIFIGYFLANSKKNTKQLIGRGVGIFFLGIILNLVLNFNLILSVSKGEFAIDLLPYVFGVDILPFAGLAIILLAIFKNLFKKNMYVVFVVAILVAFFGQYFLRFVPENIFLKYISSFFYGSNRWSYFPLFPWLAYPLIGIGFYNLKQKFDLEKTYNAIPKIGIMILFLMFMAFTIFYAVSVSANLQAYYHHGLLFFLWAIVFLAFYSFFINVINLIVGDFVLIKYVKWLGKNVTLIYVLQWVMIGNYATEIYKTISSLLYLVTSFILVLSIASFLSYLFISVKDRLSKAS